MITLVLGGTRSGKSEVAERLASAESATRGSAGHGRPGVTYIATAPPAVDADFAARIEVHRARRPATWSTLDCVHPRELVTHLRRSVGVVLVDSLGTWVACHDTLTIDSADLLEALAGHDGHVIVVSEEVGLAVHPPTEVGRRYVDAVGTLNQDVAAVADQVLFVAAGRVAPLTTFDPAAYGATQQ
ncbi:MAG: bifunctional adenosylcobinamide kinase/adenosylcobinamide-phosphate guanylyltransferase [Ornithinimicrobium sp.]